MDRQAMRQAFDALVDEHGVAIQAVATSVDEPSFAYTAGLFAVGHPEVIAFGLPHRLAGGLLNDLAFAVLRSGLAFEPYDRVHRLVANGYGLLVPATGGEDHLLAAVRLRDERRPAERGRPLPALQLVLADRDGRWPWDEGGEPQMLLGPGPQPGEGRDVDLPPADVRRADGW